MTTQRTYVVTGAASGIGKASKELLEAAGNTVIGVDLRDTDINVDLTTADGRATMVAQATELSGGRVDAVLAIAGLSAPIPATAGVNYFGAIATLEGLRPLLAKSDAPRAATVASMASLHPHDDALLEAFIAGDEPKAIARAQELADLGPEVGYMIYSTSKQALARWVRRTAPTAEWAGAGIPLNAIAPGVILTPMTAELVATEEGRKQLNEQVPMPLNGPAAAIVPAELLVWLTSEQNSHLCGQVIFVDGGYDAVTRGESTW
ncbi:SDR family oxidoreductase [Lysinibacter cavernae]|uniref:NAD(P)-dependent dehydrogenase (Short-subunit alcohol dehydrogenase family) n=1 Tax=Lysinibacter cavernae TaxID=1640652 RepID=A0A7X5QZV8_9MICO|nr:SDR family oxidoreductase [Lysinibacter cavernae]NIH52847.1 NAD(P)-dependent dehydrogenase (short-subunit alcohol dehydrogenase family) [Lysinibacter cavernae]